MASGVVGGLACCLLIGWGWEGSSSIRVKPTNPLLDRWLVRRRDGDADCCFICAAGLISLEFVGRRPGARLIVLVTQRHHGAVDRLFVVVCHCRATAMDGWQRRGSKILIVTKEHVI